MSDILGDRRASLENAFFAEQDAKARRRMAEMDASKAKRSALAEASGITDDAALDTLLAHDISPATLTALSLVPLAAAAWADGSIDTRERQALVLAAEKVGLGVNSPGHALLES